MIIINERTLALIILVLIIWLTFRFIRAIFRLIRWFFRSIWALLTGKKRKADPLKSDDWLIRAQAKQEIRFQNALPPLATKTKKRKTWKERRMEKKWEAEMEAAREKAKAEERAKFANNPNWRWDEEKQLWRHVGSQKGSTTPEPEKKQYIPKGWEFDETTKQWLSPKEIAERDASKLNN